MKSTNFKFGIISEGPTDRAVIKNIISGFINIDNIVFNALQPKEGKSGNWNRVLKYCQSQQFKNALNFNDYLIIQIDTDIAEDVEIDIANQSTMVIVEKFKQRIISSIGYSFFDKYQQQIIFAIAINEIECWLLPIFGLNHHTESCKSKLNRRLKRELELKENEPVKYLPKLDYAKISRPFLKKEDLLNYAQKQESFQLFVEELELKFSG